MQIGYDKQGLPIGLQLIGRPWGESSILHLASAIEVSTFQFSVNEEQLYDKSLSVWALRKSVGRSKEQFETKAFL